MKYFYKLTIIIVFCLFSHLGFGQVQYTPNYPSLVEKSTSTATFATNLTQGGYVTLFIIKEATDVKPTIQEVINLTDPESTTLPVGFYGEVTVPGRGGAGNDYFLYAENLTQNTSYVAYLVTVDLGYVGSAIEQTEPSEIAFTTDAIIPPPSITALSPPDDSQGVDMNAPLSITFDQDIVLGTGSLIVEGANGSVESFLPVEVMVSGNTLTVLDHKKFEAKTDYYVTMNDGFVKSATDSVSFPGFSDATTWNFTTVQQCTWKGTNSSSWSDPANWDKPFEPNANVIIPSNVSFSATLSGTAVVNDLTIEYGGRLIVNDNAQLDITGSLNLNSDLNSNADLIILGSGAVTSEDVCVKQVISSGNRLYYTAVPVNGMSLDQIPNSFLLYYWDNATGDWLTESGNAALEVGKGYIYAGDAQTLSFKGLIHSAPKSIEIKRGKSVGWNLIGNPYTCAIDWRYVGRSSGAVENAFWIYDNQNDNYGAYNAPLGAGTNIESPLIPSNHAFWVKVAPSSVTGTESVSFDDDCKNYVNNSYLKSTESRLFPRLRLSAINGVYKDELVIAFGDGLVDPTEFKTTKYFTTSDNFVQPYIAEDEAKYCIYGLSPIEQSDVIVPLSLQVPSTGTFTLRRIELTNIDETTDVYLEDRGAGDVPVIVDLKKEASYSFSADKGDCQGRFQIRFAPAEATGIEDELNESSSIVIRSINNTLLIENLPLLENVISVYTLSGNKLVETSTASSSYSCALTTSGIYLVQVKDANGMVTTRKVFVN
ncbi:MULTISPECIES: Ig-like domain-containing protein [unclassified Carboxylicivirga]|uniref:Ig-like domain-containing protein n=1 Tax=Carboxylicivirga TaxID=1628153 RepID=UPI003D34496F